MENNIEELKLKNPIIGVAVRLGLSVKEKDGTQAIHCIKHSDKNASMIFYPNNSRFECKGCSFKGDTIDLIKEVRSCDFKEAIAWLDPTGEFKMVKSHNETSQTPQGYIFSRGLTPETLKKFEIVIKNDTIEFPVPSGIKIRNFTKEPKYKNPTGEAGIFKTAEAKDKVIFVEGEMDAIKLWQETGFAVWSGTTGATFKDLHINDFKNLKKIFIGFDSDEAGAKGEEEAVEKLGRERCFKISVPYGKDWTEAFQFGMTKADFETILKNSKECGSSDVFKVSDEDTILTVKCGFNSIDEITGGFRYGNSYRVGAVDKAGKTTFLMQIATYMMKHGYKVCYLNTELTDQEFRIAMTALDFDLEKRNVENLLDKQREWSKKYKDKLFYAGVNDLIASNANSLPSFEKLMQKANYFASKGVKIFFFDNLSTFANNAKSTKKGWEILSDNGLKVINFAKLTKSMCFMVLHATGGLAYTDTTQAVKDYIKNNIPNKIFDDSISIFRRPTGDDLHGGTILKGQSSGSILIWRPYQNFEQSQNLPKESAIILEGMRHCKSGTLIKMEFDGAKGKFIDSIEYSTYGTSETAEKPKTDYADEEGVPF